MYVLLSRTQAGPGRTVKQEQEEISRNHEQTFICLYSSSKSDKSETAPSAIAMKLEYFPFDLVNECELLPLSFKCLSCTYVKLHTVNLNCDFQAF